MKPEGFAVLVLSFALLLYVTSIFIGIVGDNIWAWILGGGVVYLVWKGLGIGR